MIHVDASSVVAILLEEPEAPEMLRKLAGSEQSTISVVTAVEAVLSLGKNMNDYSAAQHIVADFLRETRVEIVAAPADIYDDVLLAYSRYGKGTGHSARLNFGDCFSYVMAKRLGGTQLCKGNDFSQTDLALC